MNIKYASSFKHDSWLPITIVMSYKTFSMEFISGKFHSYFRMCISLHSRIVLVLLALWNGTRSYIKIYPFCWNTTHSHLSVFHSHNNRRHYCVWRKQNDAYHAKCIQATVKSPVGVQDCETTNSRCISLQKKVNCNMDSAKYQSGIIHDIEIACEYVVFPHIHDIAPCHKSKSTRTFQECI